MALRLLFFVLLIPGFIPCVGQSGNPRIYGEVTTVFNKQLTGYITWGKNKMYWLDHFNALKPENAYIPYVAPLEGVRFQNGTRELPSNHVFTCRFGEIEGLRPSGLDRIELRVRDGYLIDLKKGNFDDIGGVLHIENPEGESLRIPWHHLSEVVFKAPPADMPPSKEAPITGVIRTSVGIYKGFVHWDLDENSQEHLLDGKSANGDISVAFKNILQITKQESGCMVKLKSGTEINMWGSNDVDNRNRGIYVHMPSIGRVYVPWKEFISFESVPLEEVRILSYGDFSSPNRLYGMVETRQGKQLTGYMAYDLDEAMAFEILEGNNGDIAYAIPFYHIKIIEPKNYRYSWIELTNGAQLVLGGKNDVNAENDGILFFPGEEETLYIPWKEVKRITFGPQ